MNEYNVSTEIEQKFVDEFNYILSIVFIKEEPPILYSFEAPYTVNKEGHVEQVVLGKIPPSKIPLSLFKLPFLKSIKFHDCNLQEIPSELRACTKLKTISFFKNNITKIPEWFSEFKKLEEISIESMPVDIIPLSLKSLTKLKNVHITDHFLTEFPSAINYWKNLEHLSLTGGKIDLNKIEWSIFPKLTNINLYKCNVLTLPESLTKLKKLTELQLSKIQLLEFPENMNQLQSLKQLHITKSNLKRIPDQILNLPNLEVLNLDDNKISQIPPQIKSLTKLEVLRINNNPIKNISKNLKDLANLYHIFIGKHAFLKNRSQFRVFEKNGIAVINDETNQRRELMDINNFDGNNLFSDRMFRFIAIKNGNKKLIQQIKIERKRYMKKYGITGLMEKPSRNSLLIQTNRKKYGNKYKQIAIYKKKLTNPRKKY